MESGGKAVTKRYRKKITVALSLVLPVVVLFAILNCFTTYVFYEDYKYKMNLMTEIAAKEEFSGLDAVSELLKDKDIETNEQGRRLLEQYGYWGNKGNAFYIAIPASGYGDRCCKHCDMRASFDFFILLEEKRRCVSSENFRPVGRNSDQIP